MTMKFAFPFIALTSSLAITGVDSSSTNGNHVRIQRQLFIDRIVGYLPTSDVTNQLMIDLDQYNIEEQLMQRKIRTAKLVYEQGGHSQSFAVLNMTVPPGAYAFGAGSTVWAPNEYGIEIKGFLIDEIVWDSNTTSTTLISVSYSQDEDYNSCQVGALYLSSSASLGSCKYHITFFLVLHYGRIHF